MSVHACRGRVCKISACVLTGYAALAPAITVRTTDLIRVDVIESRDSCTHLVRDSRVGGLVEYQLWRYRAKVMVLQSNGNGLRRIKTIQVEG